MQGTSFSDAIDGNFDGHTKYSLSIPAKLLVIIVVIENRTVPRLTSCTIVDIRKEGTLLVKYLGQAVARRCIGNFHMETGT